MSFAAPARASDLSLKGVPTPERPAQPEGPVGVVAPREAAAVRFLFGADGLEQTAPAFMASIFRSAFPERRSTKSLS